MLTNKAIDLKNVWVVFKRMKKVNWYHRGPNYQVCTTRANKAVKFNTKEEAEAFATKLNAGRKSYRFKVDTASKHFVNNWSISYQSWTKEVIINSTPIGIDRLSKLQSYERYNTSLDAQKSKVIETLNKQIEEYTDSVKELDNKLTTSIERAKQNYENEIKYLQTSHVNNRVSLLDQQTKLVGTKTALEQKSLDQEYVEVLGTEMDKKASILFGSKANVNS